MSKKTEQNVPQFSREELVSQARQLFHVHPEIAEAALYGTDKQVLTVNEMRNEIRKFLRRSVG